MFDDPKKDLKWLNEQLLAQEQPEEQEEDWFGEEDWLDEELKEARALMDSDYSRPVRREATLYDYEEEAEDDGEELALYTDDPQPAKKGKKPKKEKGIGGLVFLACLETLGIIAVLLWWVLWLL